MKRIGYILMLMAGVLLLMMVGCAKETGGVVLDGDSGEPVCFAVYNQGTVESQVATRGKVNSLDSIFGYYDTAGSGKFVAGKGIGVFAFHQKVKSNGYAVDYNHNMGEPDFMYNQQLYGAVDYKGNRYWTYSPTKYWPNNVNDQLSFFAYAPYDYRTSWDEDMDITCNLQGTKFKKLFRIYDYPEDQLDYLWSNPVLNVLRGDIDNVVSFTFKHICAKIGLKVGVKVGSATGVTGWDDPNTDIVIKNLKIENVYSSYTLSTIYDKNKTPQFTETWTPDGYQTVNFEQDNMVEKGVISINSTYNTFTDSEWCVAEWGNATYKRLNRNDSYMFLAPQKASDQNMQFTLTYELKTRNLKKDPVETNTITRTYTHKLSDLGLSDNAFQAGKAYTIIYLVGIDGISVTALHEDWTDTETVIPMTEE